MTVAAALAGRPSRELLLILGTVLVGQVILGWFNDLVDRKRDARHQRTGKPLADGRLDPGTVWFCLALAILLVVPLSFANGLYAGSAYLCSLAIGLAGQWVWLRKGFLSWLPWAASYALYPAFLSYGGWGGQAKGAPPELLITGLAALLGIGVHLLTALWGLVPDNEDRWTYLPLKLGLRSAPPGCCGWPAPTPSWSWSRWPSPAPTSGWRRSRSSAASTASISVLSMQTRRSLRLAVGALVLALPLLGSCGFDKATDKVYTPAAGTNDRDGDVDVLSAVIVDRPARLGHLHRLAEQQPGRPGLHADRHRRRRRVDRPQDRRRRTSRSTSSRAGSSTWSTRTRSRSRATSTPARSPS